MEKQFIDKNYPIPDCVSDELYEEVNPSEPQRPFLDGPFYRAARFLFLVVVIVGGLTAVTYFGICTRYRRLYL